MCIVKFQDKTLCIGRYIPRHRLCLLPIAKSSEEGQLIYKEWEKICIVDIDLHTTFMTRDITSIAAYHDISILSDNINISFTSPSKSTALRIFEHMEKDETLNYYIDGFLQIRHLNNSMSHYVEDSVMSDMGARVYITLRDNTEITVFSRLAYWLLSTKAELVAIFLALLTVSEGITVAIYMDSQCAILAINNWNQE
ncbi:hypothetical protein RclHR1_16510002 [Rhizophagus clarus]|uniref:RNase H type-1 domain-containing protein n=1 Tax=Rhizophagus clarus TaxID=94130 RepID=A0A2Z6QHT2_9GLOM|nr:hypothetical protein RclHR1_16510002 [Rhizophagus clarus]